MSSRVDFQSWRVSSAIESQGHSSRGPSFDSQHPQSHGQLPITSVPGNLPPSSALWRNCLYTCTETHAGKNTHTHRKLKKKTTTKSYFQVFPELTDCISQLSSTLIQMCFDSWIQRFHPTIAWTHCFGPGAEHRGGERMVEWTSSPPRGRERIAGLCFWRMCLQCHGFLPQAPLSKGSAISH